jgi:hypothetical protein
MKQVTTEEQEQKKERKNNRKEERKEDTPAFSLSIIMSRFMGVLTMDA